MKEFAKMIDAVAEAALITDEWAVLQGKEIISKDDALARALEIDKGYEEAGIADRFRFLCSEEGAVGMTTGKEYQAQWIMIPLIN